MTPDAAAALEPMSSPSLEACSTASAVDWHSPALSHVMHVAGTQLLHPLRALTAQLPRRGAASSHVLAMR